jgi:hypothetical protein
MTPTTAPRYPDQPDLAVLAQRVTCLEELVDAQFQHRDQALALAQENLCVRLEHSNGLIEQMREQARHFAVAKEVDLSIAALSERISSLERSTDARVGERKGHEPIYAILMVALSALIAAVVSYMVNR